MNNKLMVSGVVAGVLTLLAALVFLVIVDVHTVHGDEMGVMETWSGGVDTESKPPKTYILFPGFSQRIYNYPTGIQVYVMNDVSEGVEQAGGREKDSYEVQSKEGQSMKISMNLRYRIKPTDIVKFHKEVRTGTKSTNPWEERIIRPTLMRVVKDKATVYEAIEAYSGEGLVKLQQEIQSALAPALAEKEIEVENFVIEGIVLDPNYISEIRDRQVSMQSKLTADQKTKTAEAKALQAKAEARADYEKALVDAQRDKEVAILRAEQEGEQQVIEAKAAAEKTIVAAEAAAKQVVVAANAEREASTAKAAATIALGEATAAAKQLEFSAYGAAGAENYVKIEVAKNMAQAFSGVKGFIPADMKITTFSQTFMDAVSGFMGGKPAPAQ